MKAICCRPISCDSRADHRAPPWTVHFGPRRSSWRARLIGWRFAEPADSRLYPRGKQSTGKPAHCRLWCWRRCARSAVEWLIVRRTGRKARVFQSGDGPQRTSIETDADGQFALGGFNPGPVFLFVLGEGFRFQGQLIKATGPDVTVTLTRLSERPAHEMRMLKDPIPIEESLRPGPTARRALLEGGCPARRRRPEVSCPVVTGAGRSDRGSRDAGNGEIPDRSLAVPPSRRDRPALAERDFEDAAAVAESIADPVARSRALIQLVDLLPASQRDRKLPMLDCALQQARIATIASDRLLQMGEVADRWYDLGEIERAKVLFAEGLKIADQFTDKTDSALAAFAVRLARVDLPAALAIAKDFKGHRQESSLLADIACRLAAENPAEAERIWSLTRSMPAWGMLTHRSAASWPRSRPSERVVLLKECHGFHQRPELFMFLALGAKTRNESAARQAFDIGVQGIDRILRERPERYLIIGGSVLPTVEQIDPCWSPKCCGGASRRVRPLMTRKRIKAQFRAVSLRSLPGTTARWPPRSLSRFEP